MKILQNKSKTIFVMTNPPTDNCPRISFSGHAVKLRDDYKGSLKLSSKLLKKLA